MSIVLHSTGDWACVALHRVGASRAVTVFRVSQADRLKDLDAGRQYLPDEVIAVV